MRSIDPTLDRHLLNGVVPESVAIIAMGKSARDYLAACSKLGTRKRFADEVWAVNAMGGVIQHDRVFIMDDLAIQADRAEADPEGSVAGQMSWIRDHDRPIYTPRAYERYPTAIEYPLEWVMNRTGHAYFNNTVPYAFALAMAMGVPDIHLYGCDYSYSDGEAHKREQGRACLEYWVAVASTAGITVHIPETSTLLDADKNSKGQTFYGYHTERMTLDLSDEGFRVSREPLTADETPTARQIEYRYSHDERIEKLEAMA